MPNLRRKRGWVILAAGAAIAVAATAGCADQHRGARASTTGGGATPGAASLDPVPFGSIAQGTDSSIAATEDVLIVDPASLDRVWDRHTNFGSPAPRFDFHRYGIVATFAGARPTAGHSTEIVRVARDARSGDIHAIVRDFAPGSWRRLVAIATAPYHFVSIPRPAAGARLRVAREQALDFQTIDAGAQSLIGMNDPTYKGELLILDRAADFAAFWSQHSIDPLPAVDFSTQMVVAVLAGFRGSFGHSVETRRLVYDPAAKEIRIDYVVHGYSGGAAPPQGTETPYQILRVNRVAAASIRPEIRQRLAVAEIASGVTCPYVGPQEIAIATDQQTLDSYVAARLAGALPGPLPAIDFSREQAILAFAGDKPATGYAIWVAAVEILERGEVEIFVEVSGPFGRPIATPTSPFQIVTIPRTYGPATVRVTDVTPRP